MTWDPINLAKLEERPQAQPTLGNAGLVYNRLRHVFSGAQESAKTLAAYAITLAVVRDGGTVLLLDLEMGMWDARDRLREMGATDDDLGRILYVEPEAPAYDSTMGEFIHLGPALVVIDAAAGAYAIQDLDDNKRRDAELFANLWVRPFWQADVATIVLDHVVKNADNRGKYAIGSERKVGGVDVHLGFETIRPLHRGGNGLYKISTHKDRAGWLPRPTAAELHFKSDPDTHALTWEFRAATAAETSESWRPTVLMERVVEYLAQQSEPVNRAAIKRDVPGKAEYLVQAIGFPVYDGTVIEVGSRKLLALADPTLPTLA